MALPAASELMRLKKASDNDGTFSGLNTDSLQSSRYVSLLSSTRTL